MWPGCNNCGGPTSTLDSLYCGGNRCIGVGYKSSTSKGGWALNLSTKKDKAKKKQQRQNRKKGRK